MRQIGEVAKERFNVNVKVKENLNFNFNKDLKDPTLNFNVNVNKSKRFNVNVNKSKRFNVNVNVDQAQTIAITMCQKLGTQKDLKFFLKCAWHLPENTIWEIVNLAMNKTSPLHYATAALKNQLNLRGIN